jgi:uncharacterized coiled-coil DUF342 family protein
MPYQFTTLPPPFADDLIQQNQDLKAERDNAIEALADMTDRLREACHQLREARVQLNRLTMDLERRGSETARVG